MPPPRWCSIVSSNHGPFHRAARDGYNKILLQTTFSLIVPTKRRTGQLRGFLDSVKRTARRAAEVEVILVIDDDDDETLAFEYQGLRLKRVTVPPGRTMGALNTAGYAAADGQYLMLLNDDVIVRTPFWDDQMAAAFRSYPDGIALVHVNDLTFRDILCIFPCVTREFRQLAGRVSPEEYRRYRIDDHIHNIFDLITLLGHKRRVFLPGVVFEHTNGDGAEYVPDAAIHQIDSRQFDALLAERKTVALDAMRRIEEYSRSETPLNWKRRLDQIAPENFIRLPEHARRQPADRSKQPRVTIGVVSADSTCAHARQCLDSIRKYSANFELIVLDNAGDPEFNHSREMNRILSVCRTDYLVLMDDDVFVQPGWLEGMLAAMQPEAGVVTPRHRNRAGELSYAGIMMNPDDTGRHTHILDPGGGPRRIQTLCSAIAMIDMPKCGHLRFDERYLKYFLDIDYGLRVWEEGFQVVCSSSEVTHLGGATLTQRSAQAKPYWDAQIQLYRDTWVKTGRIAALRQGVWREVPEIDWITSTAERIDELTAGASNQWTAGLMMSLDGYPALKDYITQRAENPVESVPEAPQIIEEPIPEAPDVDPPSPPANGDTPELNLLKSRLEELRNRLNATETDVSNIYQSRTWQSLTRAARIFQRRNK